MASEFALVDGHIEVLVDCPRCGGEGVVPVDREGNVVDPGSRRHHDEGPCPTCSGQGRRPELVGVMELVRTVLEHIPEGSDRGSLPQIIANNERDEIAERLRDTLRKAATRANIETPIGEVERQDALRTVTEAASSLRELRELGR